MIDGGMDVCVGFKENPRGGGVGISRVLSSSSVKNLILLFYSFKAFSFFCFEFIKRFIFFPICSSNSAMFLV